MVSLKRERQATAGPSMSVVDAEAPEEGEFSHFTLSTGLHFETPNEPFLSMCPLTEIRTDESASTTSNKQLKRKTEEQKGPTHRLDLTSHKRETGSFFSSSFFSPFFQLGLEEGWGVN